MCSVTSDPFQPVLVPQTRLLRRKCLSLCLHHFMTLTLWSSNLRVSQPWRAWFLKWHLDFCSLVCFMNNYFQRETLDPWNKVLWISLFLSKLLLMSRVFYLWMFSSEPPILRWHRENKNILLVFLRGCQPFPMLGWVAKHEEIPLISNIRNCFLSFYYKGGHQSW